MANRYRKLILTVPLKADFTDVINDESVEGVRLNTTISADGPLEDILENAKRRANEKDIWVDLKGRQLRIDNYNVEMLKDGEIHRIGLNHDIELETPVDALFDNGHIVGTVREVENGRTLVIPSSTEKREGLPLPGQGEVGLRKGMSVTILDDSLKIKGYLTEKDKEWIAAASKAGVHNYMLSFTEKGKDIYDVLTLDKEARLSLKIESKAGMNFVENDYPKIVGITSPYRKRINLVAALGDLYLQLDAEEVVEACKKIVRADPKAIMASRLLESSVQYESKPRSQDLFDITCKMYLGYKRFMLGDDVCRSKEGSLEAIALFNRMSDKYRDMRRWRRFWEVKS